LDFGDRNYYLDTTSIQARLAAEKEELEWNISKLGGGGQLRQGLVDAYLPTFPRVKRRKEDDDDDDGWVWLRL